ncbi:MAG TPA: hypothetical protein PKG67_10415, partial [Turneriella sp.]|nr:hypothetical protein [Turneriella sp.]
AADFERAVTLNKEYPPALLNLALHRVAIGEKAGAESLLSQLKPVRANYAEVIADALQHQKEIASYFRGLHATH